MVKTYMYNGEEIKCNGYDEESCDRCFATVVKQFENRKKRAEEAKALEEAEKKRNVISTAAGIIIFAAITVGIILKLSGLM